MHGIAMIDAISKEELRYYVKKRTALFHVRWSSRTNFQLIIFSYIFNKFSLTLLPDIKVRGKVCKNAHKLSLTYFNRLEHDLLPLFRGLKILSTNWHV